MKKLFLICLFWPVLAFSQINMDNTSVSYVIHKQFTANLNMLGMVLDTTVVSVNQSGTTITIDSIMVESNVEDQMIKLVLVPFGGGTSTLVDSHTVSSPGTDRFYNRETEITENEWPNNYNLCIIKSGYDLNLIMTVCFHYISRKGVF